ncbi:MAG: hypothetical protein GY856_04600 [bacterium]|nr:hypothetical protein [bacterium]
MRSSFVLLDELPRNPSGDVELSVRDFFAAPTIAGIAAVIEKLLIAEIGGLSETRREL